MYMIYIYIQHIYNIHNMGGTSTLGQDIYLCTFSATSMDGLTVKWWLVRRHHPQNC